MSIRSIVPVGVAVVFVLAACGGFDDAGGSVPDGAGSGGDPEPSSEAQPSAETQQDDSGGQDVEGQGSNDEAQGGLDDANLDIDLDELEETIGGFSTGEGGGSVTIDGVVYEYTAEVCISQGPDFVATGPGQSPDGTSVWVEIDVSNFDFDGDGVDDPAVNVSVTIGQTEMFGDGPDDQPRFLGSSGAYTDEVTFVLDGGRVTGSGVVVDNNGVAVDYGATLPVSFEASCS